MTKKNDKRLCWNCEGNVSHHITQCPYCGVDVTKPPARDESTVFKNFASPFQTAPKAEPLSKPPYATAQNAIPNSNFAAAQNTIPNSNFSEARSSNLAVTEEEWKSALEGEESDESKGDISSKKEMVALLLLLPGVVFFLFGLALILFANNGILVLRWNQSIAYFYFLGALPLLYLGWRAFRK